MKSLAEIEAMQERLVAQNFGAKVRLLEAREKRQEIERDLLQARNRQAEIRRELAAAEAERAAFGEQLAAEVDGGAAYRPARPRRGFRAAARRWTSAAAW